MRGVEANDHGLIVIGTQGENNATQVVFRLDKMIRDYGPGIAQLTVRPAGELFAYPAAIKQDGERAVWQVGEEWTVHAGEGACQLVWRTDNAVVKSSTWTTYLRSDLRGSNDAAPDRFAGYLAQIQAAAARAEAAALAAERYAESVMRGGAVS